MPIRRFRLYVDETGTESKSDLHDRNNRFLCLVGVAIDQTHVRSAASALDELKRRHFDPDPDDPPLVFHRSDVVKGRGRFGSLQDPSRREAFGRAWLAMLAEIDFVAVAIMVDKLKMHHLEPTADRSPYIYAMERLVERFVLFLDRHDAVGDVMPERRQSKQNTALQDAYAAVWHSGTEALDATFVRSRLPSGELKFRGKDENVAGLQIADSLAHPCSKIIRATADPEIRLSPFEAAIRALLFDEKFDRHPQDRDRIWSYGIEEIP